MNSEQGPRSSAWPTYLVFCLPVVVLYGILLGQFSTAPLLDDFYAVITFANRAKATAGFLPKLVFAFTSQTGDYKLVFEHLVVTAELLVLQRVSLGFMIWLGNALLIPNLFVLCVNAFPHSVPSARRWKLWLPIAFLLFQLNYAETLDWAMGSLQNVAVVSFGLLSLHFLLRPGRKNFIAASGFGILAAASSSNGFGLVIAGLVLLLPQRQFAKAAVWIAAFLAFLGLYLVGYERPLLDKSATLWNKLLFFLSFLGSAAENMHGRPIHHASIALGSGLLLALLWMSLKVDLTPQKSFLCAVFLWILITAAMVSSVRISLGMQLALSVRYKIYSDLLLILAYGFAMERMRNTKREKLAFVVSLSAAIILCASSDVLGYRFLRKRTMGIETAVRAFEKAPDSASPMYLPSPIPSPAERTVQEWARVQLRRAIAEGVYQPPHL